jgi:O-antigen ligase
LSRERALRIALSVVLTLGAGLCVGHYIVRTVGTARLVLTVLVVLALAAVVVVRPMVATYLGLAATALSETYDPQVVRRIGTVLLVVGLLAGWQASESRRRRVVLLLLALLGVSLVTGVWVAPPALFQEGIALAMVYGILQGANAALHGFPPRHLQLLLMAWGCVSSVPMVAHPPGTDARFGALAFGENANTLGLMAALGAVAAACWARDAQRGSWWWTIPVGALCAYGVVLSGSRAALLCAACSAVVLFFARWLRDSPVKAALVGLGGTAVVLLVGPLLTALFLAAADRRMSVTHGLGLRGHIMEFALSQTWHHPFTGIGLGRLSEVSVDEPSLGIEISAHNTYVGLLAASGVLAGALLLGLLVWALLRARAVATTSLLPLVVAVVVSGVALEWYGTTVVGPLSYTVLAVAAACGGPVRPVETSQEALREKTNWLQPSPPPHVNILSRVKPRSR